MSCEQIYGLLAIALEMGEKSVARQRPPRFAVYYEDAGLFQQALRRAGGHIDLVDIDAYQRERETATLAAAKSIQRSLERRGHLVQGIYERVNIRESEEWHSKEYRALHRGEITWEWDHEQEMNV